MAEATPAVVTATTSELWSVDAPLALTVYAASNSAPRATVVIGNAFGVNQPFYRACAEWLAQQGWRVLTFDYRGMGASRPKSVSLATVKVDLNGWAQDMAVVIAHAHQTWPAERVLLVGHSLGAQLPGLLPDDLPLAGVLGVAAGSGHIRHCTPKTQWQSRALWWGFMPPLTRLFGYFPGGKIGAVGDIPAGAMWQWRRWCLNPRYSGGDPALQPRYSAKRWPMTFLAFSDDEMMTLHGARVLASLYDNARTTVLPVTPADLGVPRIGHFGAFKASQAATVWPFLAQRLTDLLAEAAPQNTPIFQETTP